MSIVVNRYSIVMAGSGPGPIGVVFNTLRTTASRYLGRIYIVHLVALLFILLGLIYLFDTVELLRRASKRDDVPFSLVLEMGLLKLPEVGQVILPFAVLFSAMFSFWSLNRRSELIVLRASGLSVWQFLTPFIVTAIALGIFHTTVINPAGAVLISRFNALEQEHLTRTRSLVTLFREGLWLRQDIESGGYVILNADKISLPEWQLKRVTALFFSSDDRLERRIDAATADLDAGEWVFHDAISNRPGEAAEQADLVALATNLTRAEIEESFAAPETIPFWRLPAFIRLLEDTGFDPVRLKVHFQTLLAQPFLFAAMVLIAAAIGLRPPRFRGTLALFGMGTAAGFILFFLSSYLQAMGISHQIPVILSAWAPSAICLLGGIGVLLTLEDG